MTYHTALFERIDSEKQRRILKKAGEAFSLQGYAGANINRIADSLEISVGSLYKYFENKENLFLAAVHQGRQDLERVLRETSALPGGFLEKIDHLIEEVQNYSRSHPENIRLYAELTAESNSPLAARLSAEMENLAAEYYRNLIAQSQKSGEIGNPGDPSVLAFFLDNLFLNLQFSYTGAYYQERMKIFTGRDNEAPDDQKIRRELLQFIAGALGVKR